MYGGGEPSVRILTPLILLALGLGCHRTAPPTPVQSAAVHTLKQFGYRFELMLTTGDEKYGIDGRRNTTPGADGKEAVDEDITITCGPQTARIVNGALTSGGKDRGSVKVGDTIRLTSAGQLSVNGAER
jgi:hypothetical protein